MPPRKKSVDLDPDQSQIWEKILVLAQRVDKLEYTTHDLKAGFEDFSKKEVPEIRSALATAVRDEAYRKHDWLKVGVSMVVAILLVGFVIWFTLTSKVNQLEVLIRQDVQWTPHFVTKEHLQNVMNDQLEKIRQELKESRNSSSPPQPPQSNKEGKKPAEVSK
jgi:hypothetical protein